MTRTARLAAACLASVSLAALTAVMADERAGGGDDRVLHTHYDGIDQ